MPSDWCVETEIITTELEHCQSSGTAVTSVPMFSATAETQLELIIIIIIIISVFLERLSM